MSSSLVVAAVVDAPCPILLTSFDFKHKTTKNETNASGFAWGIGR